MSILMFLVLLESTPAIEFHKYVLDDEGPNELVLCSVVHFSNSHLQGMMAL